MSDADRLVEILGDRVGKNKILAMILKGNLELNVDIDPDRLDSMWYGPGTHVVARRTTLEGATAKLIANGEIRVIDDEGRIVYDGKERNGGPGFKLETDEDWKRVTFSPKYEVDFGNWFEIRVDLDRCISDTFSTLDEALYHLIELDIDEIRNNPTSL